MVGTRTPGKLADWNKQNPAGTTGRFADAAEFGEMIVLAVKGTVAAQVLRDAGAVNLEENSSSMRRTRSQTTHRRTACCSSSPLSTSR
jgi:hypothetical protein